MLKVFLVGNLTRDPEMRSTRDGTSVCTFTVAVNRRRSSSAEAGQPEADFVRVSAWRGLGENCAKYLAKGRKVAVEGTLTQQSYTGNDGQPRSSLEVQADDVEFLTPKGEQGAQGDYRPAQPARQAAPAAPQSNGFVQVDDDELPF